LSLSLACLANGGLPSSLNKFSSLSLGQTC
jgi:hypothetical protein